jgi:hypothetical protein
MKTKCNRCNKEFEVIYDNQYDDICTECQVSLYNSTHNDECLDGIARKIVQTQDNLNKSYKG